jgi:ubiquinone/menaquinone biosynthesis C-methylase UbiE
MNLNDPRDRFYDNKEDALTEHRRILRQGGKAYCRRYNHPKRGALYRLRVQKNPA